MDKKTSGIGRWQAATVRAVAAIVLITVNVPTMADHGLPHPQLLASGTFLDEIGMTVTNKIAGRATQAVQMRGGSSLFVLQISIEAGGIAPWHNHNGIGFLVNLGPGYLTNYLGADCEPRLIYPGEAFVDPGHGNLHAVRNDSNEEVVLLATFVVSEGPPVIGGVPEPDNCGHILD